MKVLIVNYIFDASARTIEFSDYAGTDIVLAQVLAVVNAETGKIMLNPADASLVGSVNDNILTLNASIDTSGMTDNDSLLIYYDDPDESKNVTLSSKIAGEDLSFDRISIQEAFNCTNITTQTTTQVKIGVGRLKRIVIPTPVPSATIKIYDSTTASGTVLVDTITFPATLLNDGPRVVEIGASFGTGCTVVTAGATMAISVLTL